MNINVILNVTNSHHLVIIILFFTIVSYPSLSNKYESTFKGQTSIKRQINLLQKFELNANGYAKRIAYTDQKRRQLFRVKHEPGLEIRAN